MDHCPKGQIYVLTYFDICNIKIKVFAVNDIGTNIGVYEFKFFKQLCQVEWSFSSWINLVKLNKVCQVEWSFSI